MLMYELIRHSLVECLALRCALWYDVVVLARSVALLPPLVLGPPAGTDTSRAPAVAAAFVVVRATGAAFIAAASARAAGAVLPVARAGAPDSHVVAAGARVATAAVCARLLPPLQSSLPPACRLYRHRSRLG